jgi:hypothetical protein
LQGQRDIIVDGQVALAKAAVRSGVRRFIPSDFAIDLFNAPAGAPQFEARKDADRTATNSNYGTSSPPKPTPWEAVFEWYALGMLKTPPFASPENNRYEDAQPTLVEEYLTSADRKAVARSRRSSNRRKGRLWPTGDQAVLETRP